MSPNEAVYDFTSDDLQDMGEIGRGGFGSVNQMRFKRNNQLMAVKRIRSTVDEKEQVSESSRPGLRQMSAC